MTKKNSQAHKDLIRRYLLWSFKTTKESFERIERKTTQLMADEYVLKNIKTAGNKVHVQSRGEYDALVKEFETYIRTKQADEIKLSLFNRICGLPEAGVTPQAHDTKRVLLF